MSKAGDIVNASAQFIKRLVRFHLAFMMRSNGQAATKKATQVSNLYKKIFFYLNKIFFKAETFFLAQEQMPRFESFPNLHVGVVRLYVEPGLFLPFVLLLLIQTLIPGSIQ